MIETIFVFTVAEGLLPAIVTIEGYSYDMVSAYTAPIIGFLVFQKKVFPEKIAMLWNYLGLLVIASIIFLFITSIYTPYLYRSETPLLSVEFIVYPYVLIPAFLIPSAVFMHVLSVVQLKKVKL